MLLAALLWRRAKCANLSASAAAEPKAVYKGGLDLVLKSLQVRRQLTMALLSMV